MFVMPASDNTDEKVWQQLCSSVFQRGDRIPGAKSCSQPPTPRSSNFQLSPRNKVEIETRTLRLPYRPDRINAAEEHWPRQLSSFVKQFNYQYTRPVIVLCMPQNKSTKAIHKILKRACDLSAGVPSLSVNSRRLQRSIRKHPRRAAHIAAKNLDERQSAIATAPTLEPGASLPDLAIAMHVVQCQATVELELSGRTESRSVPVYVVSLVSRSISNDAGYETSVRLFRKDEFESSAALKSVSDMLNEFRDCVLADGKCDITLLRSGCLSKQASEPKTSFANQEDEALSSSFGERVNLSYVMLTKDRASKLKLDESMLSPEESAEDKSSHKMWFSHTTDPRFSNTRSVHLPPGLRDRNHQWSHSSHL